MSTLRRVAALLPLLLTGCPPKAPPTPPAQATATAAVSEPAAPPTPATELDDGPRYVMLGDGATLAAGFSATADTARAHDGSPDAQGLGRYWILRRVATHGEWLEVETVETTDEGFHHCEEPLRGLDGYALRLYVRTDEAVTVTRAEVSVTLDGGNTVTLSPGVRVMPTPSEGSPAGAPATVPARVMVEPPMLLPLPADAIGRDYTTPIRYDLGEAVGHVGPDALRLTEEITLPARLGSQVLARRDEGPLAVITVADPCVRYQLHVPAAAVEAPRGIGHGGGGGSGRAARHTIAAGAPIYWANGERAGSTRYRVQRSDDPLRREVGRVCFSHSLTPRPQSADPVLVLCFDDPDVQSLAPAEPDPGGSSSPAR